MKPSILIALALLLAAPSGWAQSMLYAGERRGAPETFRFTSYELGTAARVAVHDANLRASREPSSPVINVLRLGTEVRVVWRGEPVRNRDRVDRWYRVETPLGHGYLFGNTLGRLFVELDVDGDGQKDLASVTLSAKFQPVVRVLGAKVQGGANVRVRQFGRPRGGAVTARILDDDASERQGLIVSLCSSEKKEACRSGAALVDGSGRVLASGSVSGGLEVEAGFRYGGIWLSKRENLWAPSRGSERLNKAPCALPCSADAWLAPPERQVVLAPKETDKEDGTWLTECRSIGQLVGGSDEGRLVMGCAVSFANKPPPPMGDEFKGAGDAAVAVFVVGERAWTPVVGAGQTEPVARVLAGMGIKLDAPKQLRIAGLSPPPVLRTDGFGSLVFRGYTEEPANGELLYVDAVLGPIRVAKNGAFIPHPSRGSWRYEYDEAPGELSFDGDVEGGHKLTRPDGVGPYQISLRKVQDLVPVGKYRYGNRARPLMAPKSARHPLYKGLNKDKLKDPHAATALVFVEDDLGRTLGLRRPETFPVLWAEPIIYLYPERATHVDVRVPSAHILASSPRARDRAWSVHASPSGALAGVRDGRLFWEGTAPVVEVPRAAHVVAREDARAFLEQLARAAGLIGREVSEFTDAWTPRLARYPTAQVRVVDQAVIDRAIPLVIDPVPDTVIRLYIHVRPHDGPVERARLPSPVARKGFVVVEWGGAEVY